jgi:hypothetical protein
MKHSKRRLAIIASTTAAVLLGGGIAVAYWTSTGSGSASASTGTTTNVTVAVTAPTGLIPGAPASAVTFSVTNPDTAPVTITNAVLSVNPAFSAQLDPTKPACTPLDFALVNALPKAVSIGGGGSTTSSSWGTYSIALNNSSTNQDNCKNVSVPLVVSAS